MNNLAIIPARGGSKRIPRKNIKSFMGKPIIAYSIDTAIKCGLFDVVMVSTDDAEIAKIATECGAQVPFMRNAKNADDNATTMAVLKEVIELYSQQNVTFNHVCCIYPTAPLIKTAHLIQGYDILSTEKVNSVFPVVAFDYPVWRGFEVINNIPQMVWPEYINTRSQDLKPIYHDAGQWYWFNPLKVDDSIFTDNSRSVVLNQTEVQDIDNLTDWQIAEMKYKLSQ